MSSSSQPKVMNRSDAFFATAFLVVVSFLNYRYEVLPMLAENFPAIVHQWWVIPATVVETVLVLGMVFGTFSLMEQGRVAWNGPGMSDRELASRLGELKDEANSIITRSGGTPIA